MERVNSGEIRSSDEMWYDRPTIATALVVKTSTRTVESRARRPTYGSCIVCMDAGPVGQTCLKYTEECAENGQRAVYWMIGRGEEPRMMILDSLHLAQMLWAETVIAKSDHCYFPNDGMQFYKLDDIHLDRLVNRIVAQKFQDPYSCNKEKNKLKQNFYCMVDKSVSGPKPIEDNRSVLDGSW